MLKRKLQPSRINWAMIYVDYEYIRMRNDLIPEAVKFADSVSRPRPERTKKKPTTSYTRQIEEWASEWNHAYHTKMNDLWDEKRNESRIKAQN